MSQRAGDTAPAPATAPRADAAAPSRRLSVATLTAAAIGLLLGASSVTWRADQSLYDAGTWLWQRTPAADLVIIAIDDASLAAIGRWPWPRAVHAEALDRLAAARPRAIALDLLLSEPDPNPQADAALAAALARAAPVVLPTLYFQAPAQSTRELLPVAPLAAAAKLGHVDTETDADGVLRHAWLRGGLAEPLRPHLAVALLQAAGESVHPSIAPLRAPADLPRSGGWQRDERVRIRYAGPPGTVPTHSYASLLRGEVPASALAGKLVLVGATAPGLGDSFVTPLSAGVGPMAGVEITAQLVDALRGGHRVSVAPAWLIGLLAAALGAALALAYGRLSARHALALSAGVGALAPAGSVLLLGVGVWWPPLPAALTALASFPLWSWRRLEAAQRFIDAELARWSLAAPSAAPADERRGFEHRLAAVQRAGEQVRQAQRFTADSLAALPEAVCITDVHGMVRIANQRAAQLLDAGEADRLTGQPLASVLQSLEPLEATDWPALIEAARMQPAPRTTLARRGSDVDVLARLAAIDPTRAPPYALAVSLADVTRLTAAERGRDEMLAFVTHDLRSPQASLLAAAELSREGRLSPAQLIEKVDQLARRTLQMADAFLQLGRADEAGLVLSPFDFVQTLRESIDETRPQARARSVELEFSAPNQAMLMRGEAALVRRACVNLLTNAIAHSPPGAAVQAGVLAFGGNAVFHVRDHGAGISPELLPRLFRKYERGAEPASAPVLRNSVGLGLALVDSVARRHGGSVSVTSTPGEGARFELSLPLDRDAPPAPPRRNF